MRLLKAMHEPERFSSTEQVIVQYMLQHPKEMVDMTTRELAEKTYTSPAAVFRLCQKLGLKGYNEFKIKFISEINRVAPDGNVIVRHPIRKSDQPMDVVRKMAALEVEAIEETKNEFDIEQLVRVAKKMEQAKSIDFYAYDQNHALAEMAVYNLLQMRRPATCQVAMTSQMAQALNSDEKNLAIIISRTGENRLLIRTAQILRERKVPMIVLSCSPDTTLARLSQEFLYVANTLEYLDLGGMIFSVGVRYYMDVLFGILFARNYDELTVAYRRQEKYVGVHGDPNRIW